MKTQLLVLSISSVLFLVGCTQKTDSLHSLSQSSISNFFETEDLFQEDPLLFSVTGTLAVERRPFDSYKLVYLAYINECEQLSESRKAELVLRYKGKQGIHYIVSDIEHPETQYWIDVIPNVTGYKDEDAFTQDFLCGISGEQLHSLNERWLVFLPTCGINDGCNTLEKQVLPALQLR